MAQKFASVDEYLASFPPDVRAILQQIRRGIRKAIPGAGDTVGETISYGIPAITLNGRTLVYFAGWKHHVSLYPVPEGDAVFEAEIAPFRAAKGTLRFPLDKPIPYDLIGRVAAALSRQRTGRNS